ncbi:MAG TPA: hypothetical protein VFV10_04085 [Gammaproteobacteria bacterium]|nr:hypothetical protein [Gammaproteobacteria bacterium]
MSSKSPTHMANLLRSGRLGELTREAERRRGFTGRIRSKLPPEEAEHLTSAYENDAGELVLVMDSPAWAARVRYRAADLGVRRLRVKVAPKP